MELLIPSEKAGCLIGKDGSRIKEIESQSNCKLRVLKPSVLSPKVRLLNIVSNEGILINGLTCFTN